MLVLANNLKLQMIQSRMCLTDIIPRALNISLQDRAMSKLFLSQGKNIITLNKHGESQFGIMNSPDPSSSSSPNSQHPIIFKIKANMVQNIMAKPSYGILMHSGTPNNKKINIKYSGQKEDVKMVKLQIRWLKLPRNIQILNQEGKKINYSKIYKECQTKDAEKFEELSFQMQEPSSKDDSNNIQPKQFRFQSTANEISHSRVVEIQKRVSNNTIQQVKRSNEVIKIRQVLLLMFFSLLLGICFGIRFNRMEKEELVMQISKALKQNENVVQL